MSVLCRVEPIEIPRKTFPWPGVLVTCSRCGNTASAFERGRRSVNRCLLQLRNTCPRKEINFYEAEKVQKQT